MGTRRVLSWVLGAVAPARPPGRFAVTRVVLPALAVLLAHAGLRMAIPDSVEADDADLIVFSQQPEWGYGEQPPLYPWLCEPAFAALGVGVPALVAVRTAVLFAGCLLLYLAARAVVPDRRLAALAAFSVLLIPSLAWNSLTYLTHTNVLLANCAATVWLAARVVRDGRTADYLGLGAACGLGLLSKYNYAWFAGPLLLAGLTVGPARRRLLHPRMLLTVAVCLAVAAPHAVWLVEHRAMLADLLRNKVARADLADAPYWKRVLRGGRDAFTTLALTAAPLAAVVWACFRGASRAGPDPDPDRDAFRRVLGRFFLIAAGLIAFQVLALGASRYHERWVQPFALVFPLWLFARLDPAAVRPGRAAVYAGLLVAFAVGYTGVRAAQVGWFADTPHGWYPMRTDYRDLAAAVRAEAGDAPTVVTSEREIAGNCRLQLPAARVASTSQPLYRQPADGGRIVVVWNTRYGPQPPWPVLGRYRDDYLQAVPPGALRTVQVAPGAAGGQPVTVHFAVLAPVR